MPFPNFPQFRKFTPADRFEYSAHYLQLSKPYCDYSLNDLLAWLDINDDLEVSSLYQNLVFRFTNILDDGSTTYMLLGKTELAKSFNIVLNSIKGTSDAKLSYVPEETVRLLRAEHPEGFGTQEDIDNNDYIYNVQKSIEMHGNYYENFRRRVKNFQKKYQYIETKDFDLEDPVTHKLVNITLNEWFKLGSYSHNDPERWEQKVLQKHLKLASSIPVKAQGLFVDGKLVNINIYHLPPHKKWLIFNHIKYDYDYKDVFGYAFYNMMLKADSMGIKWLNFEQDLGKPGLRQTKMLLRPEQFLRRYSVWLEAGRKNQ